MAIEFSIYLTPDTTAPKITKIYFKSYRELVLKREINGKADVQHLDFSNMRHLAKKASTAWSPHGHSTSYSYRLDLPHEGVKYLSIGEKRLSLNLRANVGTLDANIWKGREGDDHKRVKLSESNTKIQFPHYLHVATGETETPETNLYRPKWSLVHEREQYAEHIKSYISPYAHRFAAGFNPGWHFLANHDGRLAATIGTKLQSWQTDAAQCYVNTANWGRLLIGYVYKRAADYGAAKKPPDWKEVDAIYDLIDDLEEQLPTHFAVQEFFTQHNPDNWKASLSNAGGSGTRRLYKRDKNYDRGKLLYNINANNLKRDNTVNEQKARAEYLAILEHYQKAFMHPYPYAYLRREYDLF